MTWTIEKRKQGNEIWVSSNIKQESIFVGDGYEKKEYKRSIELAKVIVKALNEYEKTSANDSYKKIDKMVSKHPQIKHPEWLI